MTLSVEFTAIHGPASIEYSHLRKELEASFASKSTMAFLSSRREEVTCTTGGVLSISTGELTSSASRA